MIAVGSRVRVVRPVGQKYQTGEVRQVVGPRRGDHRWPDQERVDCQVVFDSDGSEAWFWADELAPA